MFIWNWCFTIWFHWYFTFVNKICFEVKLLSQPVEKMLKVCFFLTKNSPIHIPYKYILVIVYAYMLLLMLGNIEISENIKKKFSWKKKEIVRKHFFRMCHHVPIPNIVASWGTRAVVQMWESPKWRDYSCSMPPFQDGCLHITVNKVRMTKRELSTGAEKETQRRVFKIRIDLAAKVLFYDRNWGCFMILFVPTITAHIYMTNPNII